MKIDDLSVIEQKHLEQDSQFIDRNVEEHQYQHRHYPACPLRNKRPGYHCPICTRLRSTCPNRSQSSANETVKFEASKMSTNVNNVDQRLRSQSNAFKSLFESQGTNHLQLPTQYHSHNNTSSLHASLHGQSLHHRAPTAQSQIVQPQPLTPQTVKEEVVYYPVIHNKVVKVQSKELSRSQRTPTRSRRSTTSYEPKTILTPTQFKHMVEELRCQTEQ